MSVTAAQLAGALCCCADSLFNNSTTADSSTLALDAASVLVRNARAAVNDKVPQAVTDVHAASLMADRTCGAGNLGLAHGLAGPLEIELDMEHGLAVGALLPRVVRFNAPVAGPMMADLAAALGVENTTGDPEQDAIKIETSLFEIYRGIGFPKYFDARMFDPELIPEMAMAAGKGINGEGYLETPPTRQSLIPSPNRRRATIREAEELFEQCFA